MPEISVQAPNSLLLIGDPSGTVPESMNQLVAATASCIAIGTLLEHDGPTHIQLLTDTGETKSLPSTLAWEGFLEMPNRIMTVQSVLGETYLERKVETARVYVRVYANDLNEPDQIAILLGPDAC